MVCRKKASVKRIVRDRTVAAFAGCTARIDVINGGVVAFFNAVASDFILITLERAFHTCSIDAFGAVLAAAAPVAVRAIFVGDTCIAVRIIGFGIDTLVDEFIVGVVAVHLDDAKTRCRARTVPRHAFGLSLARDAVVTHTIARISVTIFCLTRIAIDAAIHGVREGINAFASAKGFRTGTLTPTVLARQFCCSTIITLKIGISARIPLTRSTGTAVCR